MRRFALVLALASGCAANGDPCAGEKGVCIGLRVQGSVSGLDQLAFTIDVANTMAQRTPDPPHPFKLPVRVALFPPAGTSGTVHVSCDGSGGGVLLGHGEVDVPLVNGHAEETLTLAAISGDLAVPDGAGGGGDGGDGGDLGACAGVTACKDGDGCCPSGCNNTNDNDCTPVCGNGVVERGEICDDGNTANGDNCDPTCQWTNIMTTLSGVPGAQGYADSMMSTLGLNNAAARFNSPVGFASDGTRLWILDNATLRQIDNAGGQVHTLFGPAYTTSGIGDGPFATAHALEPILGGLTYLSSNQKLYFSDVTSFSTGGRVLREVDLVNQTVTSLSPTVIQGNPQGLTTDGTYVFYRTDAGDLYKWKPGDTSSTLVASHTAFNAVDNVSSCQFNDGIVHALGATYLACSTVILGVTDAGNVFVYAGNPGNITPGCMNGTKTTATFDENNGLAVDGTGNLLVSSCDAIRSVAPTDGGVTTLAGQLSMPGITDGDETTMAKFGGYGPIVWWNASQMFFLDTANDTLRSFFGTEGLASVSTVAGSSPNVHAFDARGSAASSRFNSVAGVVTDGNNLYALGQAGGTPMVSPGPATLIKVDLTSGTSTDLHTFGAGGSDLTRIGNTLYVALGDGSIHSIGTDGLNDAIFAGMGGGTTSPPSDGTPGSLRSAVINPRSLATDGTDLYFVDVAGLIRRITLATSTVSLVAGDGVPWSMNTPNVDGTGASAHFSLPNGLAYTQGNLYTMDGLFPCCMGTVRRINVATRQVTSIVGHLNGTPQMGLADTDGVGVMGQIGGAAHLATDGRSLFISDMVFLVSFQGSGPIAPTIREVDLTNLSLTTMIGVRGIQTLVNGRGTQALINQPGAITFDATTHSLFFFDVKEGVIQKIR